MTTASGALEFWFTHVDQPVSPKKRPALVLHLSNVAPLYADSALTGRRLCHGEELPNLPGEVVDWKAFMTHLVTGGGVLHVLLLSPHELGVCVLLQEFNLDRLPIVKDEIVWLLKVYARRPVVMVAPPATDTSAPDHQPAPASTASAGSGGFSTTLAGLLRALSDRGTRMGGPED